MQRWRLLENTWCIWPSRPNGLIEMIGGSYLASTPQLSYKRLLEGLCKKNLAIHTWRYLPSFDHQLQANQAWKDLRKVKEILTSRIGVSLKTLRLGHSLGCKLHFLSPDLGRNSRSLIALSFNNFKADRSIPLLGKFKKRLNFQSEFSPSPLETMQLISTRYIQENNLLIRFSKDNLDQTNLLLKSLKDREKDNSNIIELEGDHLTPASIGIRKSMVGEWSEKDAKTQKLKVLIETINNYFLEV